MCTCPPDSAAADVSLLAHLGLDHESLTDKLHTHVMQLTITCQSARHFILHCAGATYM